jgi:hypothetical protein
MRSSGNVYAMNLHRVSTSNRSLLFALVALATIAFTLSLPALHYLSANRSTAAFGVLLLFIVELPFYFWLIVLRPSRISPLYAVPVAAIGYLFCRLWQPGNDSAWIALGWIPLLPLELFLFAVLYRRTMRVVRAAREQPRSSDLIERLTLASYREFPSNRLFAVLMYEVGLVYYAFGGGPGIVLASGDAAFTNHRRAGLRLIFGVALVFGAFEVVGLHLLVAALSPLAAWMLTGLELYGVIWAIGLLRSVPKLPVVLGERGIHVRLGVIYSLWVPYEDIQSVQRGRTHADTRSKSYLNCAFMNAPDCVLKLRAPGRARLPYTLEKNVDEIGLMVDEPKEFLAQLERRLEASALRAESGPCTSPART